MDFLPHPVAQGAVHQLVLLDPRFAAEFGADDDGLEVMAVAFHPDVIAGQMLLDVGLNVLGGDHD